MSQSSKNNVIKLSEVAVSCRNCSMYGICTPPGADANTMALLENAIKKRRVVSRGEHLYRAGDPFSSIYCVRSGSIKTYVNSDDGSEQVTGFHLPGELLGLAGICAEDMPGSAVALETSSVCEIPFDRIDILTESLPGLKDELIRLLSQKVLHYQTLTMLLSRKSAEERLAALLLSLSTRFQRRGFSATEFYLSMSRNDIGNYLGLAVETVSRMFTRFDTDGLLTVQRKYVKLHDIERLKVMAGSPRIHLQMAQA
ncbi:MAG: fumarate/nitrate reduction transcriptional regulator Fnr [Gammaproteobacteria bacterium]|nr:fumarate/nitrate reduction transcriptional regulator Fnr [Gammaproteobacteria bacterium]